MAFSAAAAVVLLVANLIAINEAVRKRLTKHLMKDDDNSSLPIPAEMYRGDRGVYERGSYECPFQKWYTQLPENFGLWEKHLLKQYDMGWRVAFEPTGVRKNDHNYATLLGQGNTLGFVAARLTIKEDVPKFGLFKKPGVIPAVVRFSDFGGDYFPFQLARMAVKVQLDSAWAGEANLLFTESMDSFPIGNYDSLSSFAFDMEKSPLKALENASSLSAGAARVLAVQNFDDIVLGKAFKRAALAKSYYGQLPYMLGSSHAMKFSLIPKQKTCGAEGADAQCCLPTTSVFDSATASAGATAAYLAKCDAEFDLQIQVKSFDDDKDIILRQGDKSWPETPMSVATLTIPKQKCTDSSAVSEKLQASLASTLRLTPQDGIDKVFAFHPIMTHKDNRPIGEINAFRAAFYSQHAAKRFSTILRGVFKKTQTSPLGDNFTTFLQTPETMPFDALLQADVFEFGFGSSS